MDIFVLYVNLVPILFGAIVGSFLNVVIVRWPEERSIITPRSACPGCSTPIAWYDNIPMLSFVVLRARCRHCHESISWRYPLVELLTAILSWLTFHRFVTDVMRIQPVQVGAYLLYFSFVAGLIAITFIDFEHYLIPDVISLPAIPIGVLGVWAIQGMEGGLTDPWGSLLGVAVGGGSLLLLRLVYQLVRHQEGMGMGDVKMMAMLGAFLGAHPALLFIIFISSLLGSVVGIMMMVLRGKGLKYQLPFGPFLAIGGVVYLLWGYYYAPMFIPVRFPFMMPWQ